MKVASRTYPFAVVVLIVCLAGCGGPDPAQGHYPNPPRLPPPFPKARNVPVDSQMRQRARQELESALRAADPEVRTHALEGISDTIGAEDAAQLIAALDDREPLVRYAACFAVGKLKLADAHEKLLARANDSDAAVQVAARYALHRIGDYQLSHDLERFSRDPQARVRGSTALVFGLLGDPSALPILHGMLRDENAPVRQQAMESMWRLGSPEGERDLIGLTVSRFPDDRMIGLLGLAAPHNRSVIQHVRNQLVTDTPEFGQVNEVTLVAALAMGMLGCDEGYGVAQIGSTSVDPRQRLLAARAFGAIGRTDAQPILKKLLDDSDANVRVAAATAFLQLRADFHAECGAG